VRDLSTVNPSDNETANLANYSYSDSNAENAARPKLSGQSQKQWKIAATGRESCYASSPCSVVVT